MKKKKTKQDNKRYIKEFVDRLLFSILTELNYNIYFTSFELSDFDKKDFFERLENETINIIKNYKKIVFTFGEKEK